MESSPKSQLRSISLPSRLIPFSTQFETELNNLKTLEISSASPMSIQKALILLLELYLSLDELITSPQTQQALLQYKNRILVEDAFEGSIGLLDACSTLKDLLTSMKENGQNLQSALRRKVGDLSVDTHISAYLCFRKKGKRSITRSIGSLDQIESKLCSSHLLDVDQHLSKVIKVLGVVVKVTISVFKDLFLYLSTKAKTANGFSVISKLLPKNRSACDGDERIISEVEKVDVVLNSLHKNIRVKGIKGVEVQIAMERLQNLDASIEGLEAGLDGLFRRLIQSRVSLLNILAN